MSSTAYDVVIVGAGIVGAACADEFARRGMRVAVVDRDVVGGGATAAGMGHIVVMDDSEAQFALTRYSQQLWQALRPELPDDVEYEQCGTIWVAADEEEMAEVRRKRESITAARRSDARCSTRSESASTLSRTCAREWPVGCWFAEDAVLYPPCAARVSHGARAEARSRASSGLVGRADGTRTRPTLSDGAEIAGRIIVNAAGAWAPELTPELRSRSARGIW